MPYQITDHNGNIFPNVAAMCKHYNLPRSVYYNRLQSGWPLDKTLTTPKNQYKILTDRFTQKDHLGNVFPSMKAMCDHYNIYVTTYRGRLQMGWSIEKALTEPTHQREIYDHLGNKFESIEDMCKHYNVNQQVYKSRRKYGWSVEKALTSGLKRQTVIKDHLGNKFKNTQEMCQHYKTSVSTYKARLKMGWSVKKALTMPKQMQTDNRPKAISDPYGNTFNCIADMARAYNINDNTLCGNMRRYSLIEALYLIPVISAKTHDCKIDDNLTIIKPIDTSNQKLFLCEFKKHEIIFSYDNIIDYCSKNPIASKNPLMKGKL